ncbi:transcriptional regulator [Qipengyuania sp. JC766]|uniref:winged helix-turn-helix domain-containing protein n=1 Tax=Qipengyuania sp. JC766 TaxID=3232139 RepID=UPI003458BB5F
MEFGPFRIDTANRRLLQDGHPIDLSARYFDVLLLMTRHPGELLSKDRLHREVWKGIPVTDDAITQAIRALRKALSDDASAPRYIETVPKHGYRFIGTVRSCATPVASQVALSAGRSPLLDIGLLVAGGCVAGLVVGIGYAFFATEGSSVGSLSLVIVMALLSVVAAAVSAFGIGLGMQLLTRWMAGPWSILAGGAVGGLVTGGIANLLGRDTFRILVGHSPDRMTGPTEGLIIGSTVGLAAFLALGPVRGRRIAIGLAGLIGLLAGGLAIGLGGTMFGGSLVSLANDVPASSLDLPEASGIVAVLGGGLEGGIFVACLVGAWAIGGRLPDRVEAN